MAIHTCYSYVRRAFTLCALIIALCVYGGQSAKATATIETVPSAHSVVSHNTEVLSLLDDTSHSWKDVSFIDDTPDLENAEAVLGVFGIFIVGILGFVVYFLPSVVALSRDHEYKIVIIVVNIFCAWTGFVWLGILAWSVWPRRAVSSFSQGGSAPWNTPNFSHTPPPFPSGGANRRDEKKDGALSAKQIDDLEKIGRLKQQGILTEEEFDTAKKRILNSL